MSKWSPEIVEEMAKLWNKEGLSTTEIGERYGITRQTVGGIIHRNRHMFSERASTKRPSRPRRSRKSSDSRKVTQVKTHRPVIRPDEAVHLRHGSDYLHMSGQALTQDMNYIWLGTRKHANAMIEASCIQNLQIVSESRSAL